MNVPGKMRALRKLLNCILSMRKGKFFFQSISSVENVGNRQASSF
ncbi:MAG: hypothetical protein JETT_3769 [Candidatus Jettenia ecosi]|uniref:Uncharacterized protein n=1 Tax=Candidatus Jettenia ecosi TaxID=2494326 RepID=A0A533Q5Y2_9BACT|nr:MAG: hypothetical protein JETT_3769 [Candidatus Jettenia ecosi]